MNIICTLALSLLISPSSYALEITGQDLLNLKEISGQPLQVNSGPEIKLVYFWATWCPDCKEKMNGPLREANSIPNSELWLVNTEKDEDLVKNFLSREGFKFQVYGDPSKKVRKALKVFSVPHFVMLKRDGSSYKVVTSQTEFDLMQVRTALASSSAESKSQGPNK